MNTDPRANDENVIKELKEGYGIAAFNMNNFWATESVMIMNALVFHNLFHYLNRNILNPNKSKQQLKTLRYKYFIIPAYLVVEAVEGKSYVSVSVIKKCVANYAISLKK